MDYREQRALFERIDGILSASGLEQDFIHLALADRKIGTGARIGIFKHVFLGRSNA